MDPNRPSPGAPNPTPPRQYTTVGSVYTPQTRPLQPPVRRGRTTKALFQFKTESPMSSTQLQYTPLQQNSERAISPPRAVAPSLHTSSSHLPAHHAHLPVDTQAPHALPAGREALPNSSFPVDHFNAHHPYRHLSHGDPSGNAPPPNSNPFTLPFESPVTASTLSPAHTLHIHNPYDPYNPLSASTAPFSNPLDPSDPTDRIDTAIMPSSEKDKAVIHPVAVPDITKIQSTDVAPSAPSAFSAPSTSSITPPQSPLATSSFVETSPKYTAIPWGQCRPHSQFDCGSVLPIGYPMPLDMNKGATPDPAVAQYNHKLNLRTWKNLASYKNPMQKFAQDKIAGLSLEAKQAETASTSTHTSTTSAGTYAKAATGPPTQPRAMVATRTFSTNSKIPTGPAADRKPRPFKFKPDATPFVHPHKSTGVPVPLTAGPPGASSTSATQAQIARVGRLSETEKSSTPSLSIGATMEQRTQSSAGGGIVDTLPASEAATFYVHGHLPENFSTNTQHIPDNWVAIHMAKDQHGQAMKQMRLVKNEQQFYMGTNRLGKPFHLAVAEHKRKNVAQALGETYKEEPLAPVTKCTYRELAVDDAASMSTSEHAAPLLSVMYQGLVNMPEISGNPKLPRHQDSFFPEYFKY
ncbi:hypothetical protein F5Y18DRAFT_443833 [Xylariaceae sp. FL1019]|nr:hypothetical protein F5Y18DRAFT_443833 [Xylariaceae sp. FL1019]